MCVGFSCTAKQSLDTRCPIIQLYSDTIYVPEGSLRSHRFGLSPSRLPLLPPLRVQVFACASDLLAIDLSF